VGPIFLWSFGKGINRKGIGTDGGAPESSLLMDGKPQSARHHPNRRNSSA
jgi:hypothetical protein